MNRLSGSSLVLWGASALLFAAGCGGCFKSPDERRLVGMFVKPVAGAELTDADRAEGDTLPGLRVTVEAGAEWESLTSGKREAALPGPSSLRIRELAEDGDGGTFVDGPVAQVTDAGTVVFPGVEFPASGTYELELTARAADSEFVSEPVVIAVKAITSNGRPSVESVALLQDSNGDGMLNAEELPPGTPVELVVMASGMDAGTVKLTAAEPPVEVTADYVETGAAMALDLGADALEQTVDVTVLLTNPLGQQNSVGQFPGIPLDALARQALKVDQVAPTVAFTAPDAGVLLTDNALTLQVAVVGADDLPVAFTRAPQATPEQETDVGSAVVTSGVASLDALLPNGQWLLRARVMDAAGNAAIPAELDVRVANGRPSVQLVALAQDTNADGILNAAELAVGAPLQLGVTASGMEDGGTLQVTSVATGSVASVAVADGGAEVALDLDAGVPLEAGLPLELLLTNTDGISNNVGQLQGVTLDPLATPTVQVDQVPPTVAFVNPDAGVVLTDNAVALDVVVTGAEAQTVTFTRAPRADVGMETSVGTAVVTAGVAHLDAVLPNGLWLLRARVLDTAQNEALPAELALDVANGRPGVQLVTLSQDSNSDGILNALELAVGAPLQLGVTTSGMEDGGTLKASSVATGTESTVQVTGGAAQVALDLDAGVAFEGGVPLQLLLTNTDGISNNVGQLANETLDPLATPTVQVDQVPPGLTLVSPAAGATVTSNEVTLVVTTTGAEGQTVTFTRVDGADAGTVMGTATVNNGAASVAGAVTNGTWRFQAEVSDVAGNPSAVEAGEVVVSGTTFAITSPANGRVFKATDDQSASTAGMQGSVVFQPAPTGGFTVDLCLSVDPGTGPATPCPDGSAYFLARAAAASPSTGFTFPEGGPYTLRAVRSYGGAVFDVSADVAFTVNSGRPSVTALTLPQDQNSDGTLNAVELSSGSLQVKVTATDTESLAGAAVALVNDTTGAACGSGTLGANGEQTLTVDALCASLPGEFSLPLRVRVTDAAGNANRLLPADPGSEAINSAAFITVGVDTVAPGFTFTAPTAAVLGPAGDANLANATFDLVLDGAAPGAAGVAFQVTGGSFNNSQVGATSAAGFATEFALPAAGRVDYALSATPVDLAGNVGLTATAGVTVDLEPPVVGVNIPGSHATSNRDLEVQVTVTSNPALAGAGQARVYSFGSVPCSVDADCAAQVDYEACIPNLGSGGGAFCGKERDVVDLTAGVGSHTVSFPNGQQVVQVVFTDEAGNRGAAQVTDVDVSSTQCALAVSAPASSAQYVGAASDTQPASASTVEYAFTGTASNCVGRQVTVRPTGGGADLCQATVAVGGAWICTGSLSAGPQDLTVEMTNSSGVPTSVVRTFTVDLTAPGLTTTAFVEGATMLFVNASNVHLLDAGSPDAGGAVYVEDGNPAVDGAQVTFSVTVTGAVGGTVNVLLADAGVGAPTAISSDPETVNLAVTLPQDGAGVLALEVLDPAGNSARRNAQALVDVVAPSAPVMTANVTDNRAATVDLSWTVTGDDGNSGVPAGYDVRWSTNALNVRNVPALTSSQAVAIHTGDPNRNFYSDKVMARAGAGLASGTSLQVTVPPMAQSVGFVVRAQDEVGNVSTIDATATVSTEWTREAVANPGNGFTGNTSFGAVVSEVADLNGDNILDVITSSPGGFNNTSNPVSGQVHILYGGGSGFRRQTFTAPATATSQFFGADVTVGNVAGPSGGGVGQDLVVGASNFGSNAGRAYLYVGGESAGDLDTSNPYVLEGEAGLAGRFARSVHVLPDLDGDGFRELAVSAPSLDNTTPGGGVKQGRVYLYRGGTEADWTAKVTGSVSGTRGSIPASAADCVINGPTPVANSSTNTQPNNFFGEQMGWLNLPDLDGDGRAEVALPASSDSTGRVFVFSGETLRACMDADGTLSATTDAVQVLSASANLLSNAANSGFGQYCASGDVLGSSSAELLVSHPTRPASEIGPDGTNSGQGRVEIFSTSGDNAAPWTTPSVQVIEYTGSSGAVFASGVALGNFQSGGSARTDIVVGHRSASSAEGGVWFFSRNLGGTGTAYDTKASAGFRQGFVVAPTGTAMGTNVVVGDFTGDGLLDIVATDSSTAAGGNRVYLWH